MPARMSGPLGGLSCSWLSFRSRQDGASSPPYVPLASLTLHRFSCLQSHFVSIPGSLVDVLPALVLPCWSIAGVSVWRKMYVRPPLLRDPSLALSRARPVFGPLLYSDVLLPVTKSQSSYQPPRSKLTMLCLMLLSMAVVDERRMMNHLYVLDMRTLVWRNLINHGEGDGHGPTPRYFHSMEVWRDNLVLFGQSVSRRVGLLDAPFLSRAP